MNKRFLIYDTEQYLFWVYTVTLEIIHGYLKSMEFADLLRYLKYIMVTMLFRKAGCPWFLIGWTSSYHCCNETAENDIKSRNSILIRRLRDRKNHNSIKGNPSISITLT